jgi:hypothetical protein
MFVVSSSGNMKCMRTLYYLLEPGILKLVALYAMSYYLSRSVGSVVSDLVELLPLYAVTLLLRN